MKALFTPLSMGAGLVAGLIAKRLFEALWGLVDDEEPPDPKHRELDLRKLVAAMAVEGAITRLVRGLVDHGLRQAFAGATGSWPGEERPEEE